MKLTFLGSGSAFTVWADNFQSNMLLEDDNWNRLLIDCWTDIRYSLYNIWLTYKDITDIYISHLHMDHVWWLEYIWFSRKFSGKYTNSNLYIHESLVNPIWDNVLSWVMKTIENESANLNTFFVPIPVSNFFEWNWLKIELVKVIHVYDWKNLLPSYWLFFEINWKKIFITTDTQYTPEFLMPYYSKADIIFHDCETTDFKSSVHSNYQDLKKLPNEIKSKTWLYHFQPWVLPDSQKDNFLWFVEKWKIFEF